jgi:hypothetical protein
VTTDLAAWLLADDGPIAEDERELREGCRWDGDPEWWMPDWLTRDRLLADLAAKRAIVELHRTSRQVVEVGYEANWVDACPTCDEPAPCETLRLIGSVYAAWAT